MKNQQQTSRAWGIWYERRGDGNKGGETRRGGDKAAPRADARSRSPGRKEAECIQGKGWTDGDGDANATTEGRREREGTIASFKYRARDEGPYGCGQQRMGAVARPVLQGGIMIQLGWGQHRTSHCPLGAIVHLSIDTHPVRMGTHWTSMHVLRLPA